MQSRLTARPNYKHGVFSILFRHRPLARVNQVFHHGLCLPILPTFASFAPFMELLIASCFRVIWCQQVRYS